MALDGLIAIDCDPRNGGDVSAQLLTETHGEWPETAWAHTGGGGWHRLYRAREGQRYSDLGPGINVKHGAGGYIVVEPSVHASGNGYIWIDELEPYATEIALAPEWVGRIAQAASFSDDQCIAVDDKRLSDLRSALSKFDPDSYADWINAAHYLRRLGAPGFRIWCEWAQRSPKYDDGRRDAANVWQSIARPVSTYKVLLAEAQRRGWKNPRTKDARADANTPPRAALDIEFADEIPDDVCPIDELVERAVVRGAMSVVFGDSNSGKTFFKIDMGAAVARGVPWMGRNVEQGMVVYLASESPASVRMRLQAYQRHHGVRVPNFCIVRSPINLFDGDADTQRVIDLVHRLEDMRAVKCELIIGDTLSRLSAGANENSGEDMSVVIKHADLIREQAAAHFSLIHHCGKDAARGARGWSGVRGATDTEIEITDDGSGIRAAEMTKQRDLPGKGERVGFRLEIVNMGVGKWGQPITSCVALAADAPTRPAASKRPRRDVALDALHEAIAEYGEPSPINSSTIPRGVRMVRLDRWRQHWVPRAGYAGKTPDSIRSNFNKDRAALLSRGKVGFSDPFVWPL